MAAMMLSMVFIGAAMVASLTNYQQLVAIHRPLGTAILVLVILRYVNRRLKPLPDFLPTMSARERVIVTWSERLLYSLMFALPLVGWGMLSAARYPITLLGALRLPPILPKSPFLFEMLRTTHTLLAYLFFLAFLAHLGGVLFHAVVLRDGIVLRMAPWRTKPARASPEGANTTTEL
jgi:cytochrome b561